MRNGLEQAYLRLEVMERRAPEVPHRTRYLQLINDYGRRSLDAQREWLDAVQQALGDPPATTRSPPADAWQPARS